MLRQYLGAEQLPHESSQQSAGRLKNKLFIPAKTAAGSAVRGWEAEATLLHVATEVKQLIPLSAGSCSPEKQGTTEGILIFSINDLPGQGGVLPVRTSVLSKMLLLAVLAMEILLDRFSSTGTALSGIISLSTIVFFVSPSIFLPVSPGI